MFPIRRMFAIALLWAFSVLCGAAPTEVTIQGALSNDDGPLPGNRVYQVQFYDAANGGNTLGSALTGSCTVSSTGRWAITLTPPLEALDAAGEIWYELAIDSAATPDGTIDADDVFSDRIQASSVLFARRADDADTLDGMDSADFATTTSLAAGLATKSDTGHSHAFSEITGTAADAQIPNDITIDQAAQATTATYAANADTLDDMDSTDFVTTGSLTDDMAIMAAQYVLVDLAEGNTDVENAAALQTALTAARALSPSASNRVAVVVPPGRYDLGTGAVELDTAYMDLVGLTTDREAQYIYGTSNGAGSGVLMQTADNVRIENLKVECTNSSYGTKIDSTDPSAYFPSGSLPGTAICNCEFTTNDTNAWSMRLQIEYSGTYEDCTAGWGGFGYRHHASGTFTNCTAGDYAFGSTGEASGNFINCTAGTRSFGYNETASGSFTGCTGGTYTFGTFETASGTFKDCKAGSCSFGYRGTASGTFNNCTAGDYGFGFEGTASGTFNNCTAGDFAFGCGHTATTSGVFTDCTAGDYSFGYGDWGTISGTFTYCIGGENSFGNVGDAASGKFYFCRAGTSSFPPTGSPTILYCIKNGAAYP